MNNYLFVSLIFSVLFISCEESTGENHTIADQPSNNYADWYQVDSGKATALVFASYKTTMLADGKDRSLLRISAVDSNGMEIKDAALPFQISVRGDVTILDLGEPELEQVLQSDTLSVWASGISNGVKELWLQAGHKTDRIKVEVSTEGLWPASHEIHTIPADVEWLKPTKEQIGYSPSIIPKMLGADISFLPQLESEGMRFKDDGIEKDAIAILKDHGFNTIRLRTFVNPENEKGYAPGTGFCGTDYTLQMAKRIKDADLNLLLDFHYSDTWADPQKQFKPKTWEDLAFEELTTALKDYTKAVLTQLKEQGTVPDIVQIGNEVNHGVVWPEGHISNLDNLASLLKAGVRGCSRGRPQHHSYDAIGIGWPE